MLSLTIGSICCWLGRNGGLCGRWSMITFGSVSLTPFRKTRSSSLPPNPTPPPLHSYSSLLGWRISAGAGFCRPWREVGYTFRASLSCCFRCQRRRLPAFPLNFSTSYDSTLPIYPQLLSDHPSPLPSSPEYYSQPPTIPVSQPSPTNLAHRRFSRS